MGGKPKGAKAERELVEMLHKLGYVAVRVAGSGTSRFPCPDVLASNGERSLAIECKATKQKNQYFSKNQIIELEQFAKIFGADPMCAIKFSTDWHFIEPHRLRDSGTCHATDRKHIKLEGCKLF